jgi:hypothetical protein
MVLYAKGRVAFGVNPCSDQHYYSCIWNTVKSTLYHGNKSTLQGLKWVEKMNSTKVDFGLALGTRLSYMRPGFRAVV